MLMHKMVVSSNYIMCFNSDLVPQKYEKQLYFAYFYLAIPYGLDVSTQIETSKNLNISSYDHIFFCTIRIGTF